MKLIELVFLIGAISFVFGFFFIEPSYTGFQTLDNPPQIIEIPQIEILLTQDTFIQSQPVLGQIKLNVSGETSSNDKITARLGSLTSEKNLMEIIRELKIPHKQQPQIYTGNNPESSKTLVFDSEGFKAVGIKLRKGSNLDSITLSVEGSQQNNQYPTYPKLDFGAKSLYNDWEYFGDLEKYSNNAIKPLGLEENNPEEKPQITPGTKYCGEIELPKSKSFNITAKYKKITSVGTPKLEILDSNDYNKLAECNLPLTVDSQSNWHSCIVTLDFPIDSKKLICFSVIGQGALIELSQDAETTPQNPDSTGYTCDSNTCQLDDPNDYYIKVFEGVYPKKLQTTEQLIGWETSQSVSKLSINNYLTNCQTYDFSEQFCMMPIKIISDSAGKIILKNLNINYRKGPSQYTENKIYDLSVPEEKIYINESIFIDIPLSIFLLYAPPPPNANLTVETTTGLHASGLFDIVGQGSISDPISSVENKIQSTKTILTNYQNDDVITTLGLKGDVTSALTKLSVLESNLTSIKNSALTQEQKDNEATNIGLTIDSLTTNLPRSISKKTVLQFKPPRIDYKTLVTEIPIQSGYESTIYSIQDRIDVDAEAQLMDLIYFSGQKETVTLIKKTIKSTQPLSNVEIIERIPKTISESTSNIIFRNQPTILKEDPVVKFLFPQISAQNPGIISYIIKKDVMSYVEDTDLLYIPTGISNDLIGIDCGNNFCNYLEDYASCPEDCSCGNNICDNGENANTCFQDCGQRFPWGIAITLTITFLLTLYGIYFYLYIFKNQERYQAYIDRLRRTPIIGLFFKKKRLFKSEQDRLKLKQFVSNSLSKGFTKEQIKDTLINKGWTKEQIDEIIKK